MVLLAIGACARRLAAEPFEEVIAEQVQAYTAPLREWLPLELQFAREVCELNDEQMAVLRRAADQEIELIAENTAAALRLPPNANEGRVAYVANMRKLVAVGLEWQLSNEITHSIVCRTLQEKWPDAWERFEAERQRLDERRKRAAIMAEVAALDDLLMLSQRQRTELCDRLADERADVHREGNIATVVDPCVVQLQTALAGGYLGDITFPEAALAEHLLPSQLAAFKDSQRPWREQAAFAEDAALAQEIQRRQAAAPPAERIAKALMHAKERERIMAQRKAQAARQPAPPAAARLQAEAAEPQKAAPTDERRRQMTRHIKRLIDTLGEVCELSESQREKLLVAGKLDIEKLYEKPPDDERPNEGNNALPVAGELGGDLGDAASTVRIFSDELAYFQKALRGTLLDEQKQKLAAAARVRRDFERRALIAAAVVGFERAAALTSRQCEELSFILEEALDELDQDSVENWRTTCARKMSRVDDDRLAIVVTDIQLPFVKRHQAAIAEAATRFEQTANAAPQPVLGGGMF